MARSCAKRRAVQRTVHTGYYFVRFDRDVSFCGYVATTDGYAGPTGTVQGTAYGYPQEVFVRTVSGTTRVDMPFHVVVTC
jgi:hypothetical protein